MFPNNKSKVILKAFELINFWKIQNATFTCNSEKVAELLAPCKLTDEELKYITKYAILPCCRWCGRLYDEEEDYEDFILTMSFDECGDPCR